MVTPKRRLTARSSASTRRTVAGSRPEKGSSQSSSRGFSTRARARAARLVMPPESWPGSSSSTPARSTASKMRCTSARISASPSFVCSRSGSATLSKTETEFSSAPPWNIMPTLRR